jgi:hypothetical protein
MRSHAVPGYPDPTFSSGGVSQSLGRKNGIDPNSPVFQAAQKTCQSAHAPPPGSDTADISDAHER